MSGLRKAVIVIGLCFSHPAIAGIPSTTNELQKQNAENELPRCLEDYRGMSNRPRRVFVGVNGIIRDQAIAHYAKHWAEFLQNELDRNQTVLKTAINVGSELRLTVETFPRGQVGSMDIDKTSGSKIFDSAMVELVNRVSAQAPFPQDVCMKVDIVHLTISIQNTVNGPRVLQPK